MENEPIQAEITEEEIKETPATDDPQKQLEEMTERLAKAEAAIKEREQEDRQQSIKEISETHKATWLDYLLPKLDPDISLDELTEITETIIRETNRMHKKPVSIGEPSNAGHQTEKTTQMQLEEAATKAKRTGKAEDRAFFSALKQKLGGNL